MGSLGIYDNMIKTSSHVDLTSSYMKLSIQSTCVGCAGGMEVPPEKFQDLKALHTLPSEISMSTPRRVCFGSFTVVVGFRVAVILKKKKRKTLIRIRKK